MESELRECLSSIKLGQNATDKSANVVLRRKLLLTLDKLIYPYVPAAACAAQAAATMVKDRRIYSISTAVVYQSMPKQQRMECEEKMKMCSPLHANGFESQPSSAETIISVKTDMRGIILFNFP